jgi:oxalate decarboxylase/phosphoglucose isomerase-like protein (cupin superfamily)
VSKLDQYIYTIPEERNGFGDTYASPCAGVRGDTAWPGCNLYAGFTVVKKAHMMDETHIHHGVEEYLIFTGSNLLNPFDYDAEIEILLGEDPDHMELVSFTQPTIIRIPQGFWHCPINFKRIGKPVNFIPLYPNGTWSRILRRMKPDGYPEYIYEDTKLRRCVKNPEQTCTYCGKCFAEAVGSK